jgi:hypothetical protein
MLIEYRRSSIFVGSLMRFALCVFFGFFIATSNALTQGLDERQFSMSCKEQLEPRSINCDYRHSPDYTPRQISGFLNSTEIQLDPKTHSVFPASGETSSILILLDVSDARRAVTIRDFIVPSLTKLLGQNKPHQRFGLAVFDGELKVLAPIVEGSAAARGALKDVSAQGLATEFYKSLLRAVEVLEKTDSQRKILIVVSDGKAEDTSYSRGDVVQAAERAGVSVLSVGYSERGSDAAYLQTLQRLSSDTHGVYLNGRSERHTSDLISSLNGLEKGGRVQIPAESVFGVASVKIVFGLDDEKKVTLSQDLVMSETRSLSDRVVASLVRYWYIWLAAVSLILLLTLGLRRFLLRRADLSLRNRPYGLLVEMDSKGSRHVLKGSATRLGRGRDNDLVFANNTVSLNHAEIHRRRDGRVLVTDLSSSNGVLLNSGRVSEAELNSGDILELGEVRLRYERTEG